MRPKVTVISAGALGDEVAQILASGDHIDVATVDGDLPGSHVVVTAASGSDDSQAIADRAPASVILVAAGREVCQALLDATLFPAPRVVGVTGGGQEVADAAAAVAFDRYSEHDCLVAGPGGYEPARARIGARGVRELVPGNDRTSRAGPYRG